MINFLDGESAKKLILTDFNRLFGSPDNIIINQTIDNDFDDETNVDRSLFNKIMSQELCTLPELITYKSTRIDTKKFCRLPKLEFDKLCTWSRIKDSDSYEPVIISADTGSGKSIRMCEFIVNNPRISGVVFTANNANAVELYENLSRMGMDNLENRVLIYNCDNTSYQYYKNHPDELVKFDWIICYNRRAFGGNLEYYLNTLSEIKTKVLSREYNQNYNKVVFIDECVSEPSELVITGNNVIDLYEIYAEDFRIEQARRKTKFDAEVEDNPELKNAKFIEKQLLPIDDESLWLDGILYNIIDKEIRIGYNKLNDVLNSEIDTLIRLRSDSSQSNLMIYGQQALSLNYKGITVREIKNNIISKSTNLMKLYRAFMIDKFIIDKRSIDTLKIRINAFFKIINEITLSESGDPVKLNWNNLLNNVISRSSDPLFDELDSIYQVFYIGINSWKLTCPLIIFDANANINYVSKSKEFRFKTLDNIIEESYGYVPKKKTNVGILKSTGYKLCSRRSNSDHVVNRLSNLLNTDKFEIKDKSLVLWFKDWDKGTFDPGEFINKYAQYYHKDIRFLYYSGSEIKGTNKFIGYKNIYILGQFVVNNNHVIKHRLCTGSDESYTAESLVIDQISQAYGRIARSRKILSQEELDASDPIEVYFSDDFGKNLLERIRVHLGIEFDEDLDSLRRLITIRCLESSGKQLRSSAVDNMIKLIKAYPEMYEKKCFKLPIKEYKKYLGDNLRYFDWSKMAAYIRYFKFIGISITR